MTSNIKADRLAESYRRIISPEVKAIIDPFITDLAEALGESPEAWRGAELMMARYGQMVEAIARHEDADFDLILTIASIFTGAVLDHPAMRALRASS